MRGPLFNAVLALFSGVLAGVLVYLFYASELRERVETKLFDIRTRLAPTHVDTGAVAVVAINQETIAAVDSGSPPPADKAHPVDLSFSSLERLVKTLLTSAAQTVVVLLPPQVFSYKDPRIMQLTNLARRDRRLWFGTFDLTTKQVSKGPNAAAEVKTQLPLAFQGLNGHVFKADITRNFRRAIIRSLIIDERGELPYLTGHLLESSDKLSFAELTRTATVAGATKVELNYFHPDAVLQIPAQSLLADAKDSAATSRRILAGLKGKIVLVGYTAYRPLNFQDREATYANTPWQAEGDDVESGIPVVTLTAIGILNLLNHAWLHPAPVAVNVLQTALLALLALATWRLSIGFASLLFIGGWSVILIMHAFAFAYLKLHIPLADAFLWSSIATISGAFLRLRFEGHLRVKQEARFAAEKELAQTQERFLSRFAGELADVNARVSALLESMRPSVPAAYGAQNAYVKAVGSSEELGDYLGGILQFASLHEQELAQPTLVKVDLAQVTASVLRHFESRRVESKLQFGVTMVPDFYALADRTLVSQILYNLVSNAVKYAPAGSTILINGALSKNTAQLSVTDDGPGIAPEFQEHIFEKFYRVKDDFVYKHKGHGLGLYLSRFFAAQIAATIDVKSPTKRAKATAGAAAAGDVADASQKAYGTEFTLRMKAFR